MGGVFGTWINVVSLEDDYGAGRRCSRDPSSKGW